MNSKVKTSRQLLKHLWKFEKEIRTSNEIEFSWFINYKHFLSLLGALNILSTGSLINYISHSRKTSVGAKNKRTSFGCAKSFTFPSNKYFIRRIWSVFLLHLGNHSTKLWRQFGVSCAKTKGRIFAQTEYQKVSSFCVLRFLFCILGELEIGKCFKITSCEIIERYKK